MTELRTLLIIEDNLDDFEVCQRALVLCHAAHYQLLHALSGDDGLRRLKDNTPDCVLLDYSLPKHNGLMVLRQIRVHYPYVPVVILTGQGSETLAAQFIRNGAQDYIIKSTIDEHSLHRVITQAMDYQRQADQSETITSIDLMIVDDSSDDREHCLRTLSASQLVNYHCREAASGEAMFASIARDGLPACIILDYSLPGKNGLVLLQELMLQYPFLPVIIMTGQGNERVAVQAIKNGAKNYIVKSDLDSHSFSKAITDAITTTALEQRLTAKEAELRDVNQLNQAVMTSTTHLLITTDSKGIVTSFNKAAENALGYRSEDVVGKQTPALWHDEAEVIARARTLSDELKQTIAPGFEVFVAKPRLQGSECRQWTFTRKDKTSFPIYLTVTCLRDVKNNIIGYLGVIEDISERERDERVMHEVYQTASSSDLDFDSKMQYILDAGCRYLGLKLGLISKIRGETYEVLHTSSTDAIQAGQQFALGDTYCTLTFSQDDIFDSHHFSQSRYKKHPCYQNFKLESYIGLTLHLHGTPYGTLNFSSIEPRSKPFSEREKTLLRLIAQWVEFKLSQNQLIEHLYRSNEELERFAYVCSHDLQEPLRMIRSFSEKLQMHMGDSLSFDEKGKKYFKFIIDGASRAQHLIADILMYSSINNDAQSLEVFNVNDIIHGIKENMMVHMEESNAQLTCDVLPDIKGNKTQLFQLLQNLINNGMKYQPKGATPHVHVGIRDAGDYWEFSVKDNGIGMEQRHHKKIFDVFRRLHRKSEYAGTGVGLSICKKIIERHAGQIWVESEKNVGSTFYFTLLKSVDGEVLND